MTTTVKTNSVTFEGVDYSYTTFSALQLAEYRGLTDMYHSEGGFKDGSYLERFPREGDGTTKDANGNPTPDFFSTRKKLAHYENIFAPNLDAKVEAIFAKAQIREIEDKFVKLFIKSPTKRRGESMSEYQRRKLLNLKLMGSVFEILDGPVIETTGTGANNGSKDLMPWTYFLTPMQTEGYNIDNGGSLDMLVYFEDIQRQNSQASTSKDSTMRIWLKTVDGRFVTFRKTGDDITDIKFPTFFPVDLLEDNTRYDTSRIAKSKYIGELSMVKAIYNTTSWFNDSFFKNCFAFLAVNGKINSDIDLSNAAMFLYQGDNVNAPAYVAPPTAHLETMIKEVERLVQQLNSNMNSVIYISVMASGEARKEADKTRIQQQKQDASRLEENETWMINIALKNYIKFKGEYTVLYIKDYESLTKADELEPLQVLIDSTVMKEEVLVEIGADMIAIAYASNPKRAKLLEDLQRTSVDKVTNDAFDKPPVIEDDGE